MNLSNICLPESTSSDAISRNYESLVAARSSSSRAVTTTISSSSASVVPPKKELIISEPPLSDHAFSHLDKPLSGGSGAQSVSVVTPFLRHINESSPVPSDNFHRYCYRHNPEITCNKHIDQAKMDKIQHSLEKLPPSDQEAVTHVWSIFSAAPHHHRELILRGLLSQCCFPQLSFVLQEVGLMIKIDFIATLPHEIALKILCYLDCRSLCNAAQVSRKWKLLADDDRVWHHMCEQHIDRKCPNCGWGLPLMHMKRARENHDDEHIPRSPSRPATSQIQEMPPRQILPSTTDSAASTGSDEALASTASLIEANTGNSREAPKRTAEDSADQNAKRACNEQDAAGQVQPQVKKRPWKSVYCERYKVEKNWRKGIYTVKTFVGHMDGVTCLQFNGKYLMTGSYDTTVKIWELGSGECIRTLTGHTKGIRLLVFDSQKLITCGLDSTIKIWNYRTGQCIATYRGHEDAVVLVDFSNKSIVSGSADHTVKVWHVDSRTCFTLRGHSDWVNHVKIHAPSNTIFSASDDTTIRMWDLKTNQCLRVFGGVENNGHIGQVQCVIPFTYKDTIVADHADEDSENAAATENDGDNGRAGDVPTSTTDETVCGELPENPNYPNYLLTSSLDNTIKLWDVKTGKCVRTQFGHIEGVWNISADTFRIISGAHDRLVKVWDVQSGKCLHTFGHNSSVSCVGLSDSCFAAGLESGIVKMYCFK